MNQTHYSMTIRKATILFAVLFVLPITFLIAQPGNPDNPPAIPIDGGVGWLAAAGVAYGVRKLYKKHQEADEIEE